MGREPCRTKLGARAPHFPTDGVGPACRRNVVKYWNVVVTILLGKKEPPSDLGTSQFPED
eukprot:1390216-Pleurochrysis_carterae.AAC.1